MTSSTEASPESGPDGGVIVGTPDQQASEGERTVVMQIDLNMLEEEPDALAVVDPTAAPIAEPAAAPVVAPPQPARQRSSSKTMVGIPLAEQLKAQEEALKKAAADKAAADKAAADKAAADKAAAAQPRRERRPAKTMIGVPLAEQIKAQEAQQKASDDEDKTMVVSPDALGVASPSKPTAPMIAEEEDDDSERTVMMKAFEFPDAEADAILGDKPAEPTAPAPTQTPAPSPAPRPSAVVAAEPVAAEPVAPHPTDAAPIAAADALMPLPALPDYAREPDALQPPSAPSGLFAPVGYALKTLGFRGRIKKEMGTLDKRRQLLVTSREDILVQVGQRAWDENIPTQALASHRAAIEQARSQSADLQGQVAALDETLVKEREQVEADNEARNRRVDGLQRQHEEKDREYQRVSHEHKEAANALHDAEKDVAVHKKALEKLNGLAEEKRPPNYAEKVAEAQHEIATMDSEIPALRARVQELDAERARSKDEVSALRDQLKAERAAIAEATRGLEKRAQEIEGQKASIRGEIAGKEAGLREPLMAAGAELNANRAKAPTMAGLFASIDQHDAAMVAETERAAAYKSVEAAFLPAAARKGWTVLGIGVGALVLVIVALVVVLSLVGGGGGMNRGANAAIPKNVDGIVSIDIEAVRSAPLVARLTKTLDLEKKLTESREMAALTEATGLTLDDLHSAALGMTSGKRHPLMLVAVDANFDHDKVKAFFVDQGYTETETETEANATWLNRRGRRHTVLGQDVALYYKGKDTTLLEASPLLGGTEGSVADNEALSSLASEIDTSAEVWVAVTLDAAMAKELDEGPVTIEAGDRVAASLDLSSGVAIQIHLILDETRSKQVAEMLEEGKKKAADQVGDLAKMAPPIADFVDDIKSVIENVTISQSGDTLHIEASVPESVLDRALDKFESMLPALLGNMF